MSATEIPGISGIFPCRSCRFWRAMTKSCHLNPKQVIVFVVPQQTAVGMNLNVNIVSQYPTMDASDDGCGKGEPYVQG